MKLLNKPPFRRGDVVRCVRDLEWADHFKPGETYTILRCGMLYGAWTVEINDGLGLGWWADRFVKVSEENNSETVERRTC